MDAEVPVSLADEQAAADSPAERPAARRLYQRIELLSAIMLALATVATAWSGYQAALWGGEQLDRSTEATRAVIRAGYFTSLAEQRISLHNSLFGQWAAAVGSGNTALANFLFARFPEPLKGASIAWQAEQPLSNPAAPATPFEMPQYVLSENTEVARWEALAAEHSVAAAEANAVASRYWLFTIIFASVLFFGGISGKFRWKVLDLAVLVLGALVLVCGLIVLFLSPLRLAGT
jgi:hypothetical protein